MIIELNEFIPIRNEMKANHKCLVFTNGCFDIIHRGHIEYLAEAKSLGDCLVIGLNSDESVKRLKGNERPINIFEDRAIILDALKFVDYIIKFDTDTPFNLINEIKPDILVKGGDYSIPDIVGADIVLSIGGRVEVIPFVHGKSSSNLIEKIKRL